MKKILLLTAVTFLAGLISADALAATTTHKKKHAPAATRTDIPIVQPVVATYDVYVGGAHLLTAEFVFRQQKGRYGVAMNGATVGLWHRFLPWDVAIETTGKLGAKNFLPEDYRTVTKWQDQTKKVGISFDKRANPIASFDPPETIDNRREMITDEQKRGAVDPLSGALQILANVAMNQTCESSVRVFEGKRLFSVSGEDLGMRYTDPDDYGLYKGDARQCDLRFTMIAGKWKDGEHSKFWQTSDGKNGRAPITVWFARVAPEWPEVAVRAESTSVWGAIVIHLSKLREATSDDLVSKLR